MVVTHKFVLAFTGVGFLMIAVVVGGYLRIWKAPAQVDHPNYHVCVVVSKAC